MYSKYNSAVKFFNFFSNFFSKFHYSRSFVDGCWFGEGVWAVGVCQGYDGGLPKYSTTLTTLDVEKKLDPKFGSLDGFYGGHSVRQQL